MPGSVRSYTTRSGTRYSARFYDELGHQREKRGFLTSEQAQLFLLSEPTITPSSSNLSMSDLLDQWMASRRVAPTTLSGDERRIRLYITPHLGQAKIKRVTPTHLAALYRTCQSSGLSASSVRKIHTVLHTCFQWAVDTGLVETNPAHSPLASPPTGREIARDHRQMHIWDTATVARFLKWCSQAHDTARVYPHLTAAWILALFGGLRRSEIAALQWSDVYPGYLVVRQALTSVYDRSTRHKIDVLGPTKSGKHRQVAYGREIAEALDALPEPHVGRIFDTGPEGLSRAWTRVCDAFCRDTHVTPITLHELRHTHASLLLAAGVQPKVVQERLGHASMTITLDVYAHLMPNAQRDAVDSLDTLVRYHQDNGQAPPVTPSQIIP